MSKESSKTKVEESAFSDTSEITARAREENRRADQNRHYFERRLSLRLKAGGMLKSLLDMCRSLKEFRDAKHIECREGDTIILNLRDGRTIEFVDHASENAPYLETFKFWGFKGPEELYGMPKRLTDEFFDKGIAFVEGLYGKDACGLERLIYEVEREEDLPELMLLNLKAEDMVAETHKAFAAISERVKEKRISG